MNAARRHVVIAGAGVAGLEAALALHHLAPEHVSVELISPDVELTYRPLAVAEPFHVGEMRTFPLQTLARAAGAKLTHGRLEAVDPDLKTVTLDTGEQLDYDVLVLALGARMKEAVSGAITFRGSGKEPALAELLDRAKLGAVHRIAFAVPSPAMWPLPLYELAFLMAEHLADEGVKDSRILLVTPEDQPLGLFGPEASAAIRELLEIRSIEVHTSAVAVSWSEGVLHLAGDRSIRADAAVALPRLEGPTLTGIPHDGGGWVPTDEYGWVLGLTDVYAVGDITQLAVKQGGLAAAQADAAASAIAADAGAHVRPTPFKPILRGLLLTGLTPRYLRSEPGKADSIIDTEPLWWPPAKIVGRYLTPFLADHLGLSERPAELRDAIPMDVELETTQHRDWARI